MKLLLLSVALWLGGISPYTERGTIDFDDVLVQLKPLGTWVAGGDGEYLFQPHQPYVPMGDGRWIYTDYGWFFQGSSPHGWVTEHYGVWKLGEDAVWRWKPDDMWRPDHVEWRTTDTHIGWRSTPMDFEGNPTEPTERRYADAAEWFFIPREKLRTTITRADLVTSEEAEEMLELSEPLFHTYYAWREIDRQGPDPYDLYQLSKPRMISTSVSPDIMQMPGLGDEVVNRLQTKLAEEQAESVYETSAMGGADSNDERPAENEELPKRTILSLPEPNAPLPREAKSTELYVFRPKFHQDVDGIMKRIEIWRDPNNALANHSEVTTALEATSASTIIIDGSTPNPNFPNGHPPVATAVTQ